ncbi:MAG: Serine-type D-Ala-D-Ala carboxypeptidase [Chthoniobacteraceae bacterium]|nr:Serine-type D-Ala-D-Ala carboxypeptidase [Chthoniobacteraceae bacterium]
MLAIVPFELHSQEEEGTQRPTAISKPSSSPFHLLAEGELPIGSAGAIVLDAYTGATLYEKGADLPLYPASTTKIMTALLVIEAGNLDQEVEIAVEDSKVGESSLSILPGERFTRRQMLFGLMLKSANDVAHALARDNAGTVEAFAVKMTTRAKELGALNTSFRNPHGLHNPQHFTTARDLAIIGRAAMSQPYFRQVAGTKTYSWTHLRREAPAKPVALRKASTTRNAPAAPAATPAPPPGPPVMETWALRNHHRMLFEFPGCTGGKTGFTNPAQHTLVTAALRDGREVIAAVMKGSRAGKWEDTRLLLTYGFEHPPGSGKPAPKF